MDTKNQKYPRGKHPNTLASLKKNHYHGGRPYEFTSPKKTRSVTVTEEGWENLKILAQKTGCKGISEFLEKVSRGLLEVKEVA